MDRYEKSSSKDSDPDDLSQMASFVKRWKEFKDSADPITLLKPVKRKLLSSATVYVLKQGKWGGYYVLDFEKKICQGLGIIKDGHELQLNLNAAFKIGTDGTPK